MKKILLIGRTNSKSALRLKVEAGLMGLVLDMVKPEAVFCDEQGSFVSPWPLQTDIWSYDTYFFRGLGANTSKLQPFINQLEEKGCRVVEKCLFDKQGLPEDKFVPPSASSLYSFPETQTVSAVDLAAVAQDLSYPVVMKKIGVGSSMGRGVGLIHSSAEAADFCGNYTGLIQVQRYHDISYDTRVLVIGGECVGGFNRYKNEGQFLTTMQGGEREVADLTETQKAAAIEVAALKNLEIAGIDMFVDDGKIYIIEANVSPQFMAFEKITGKNVAKKILEHLAK